MPSWRDLSDVQRDNLLRRWMDGENVDDLASETEIYSVTLRRALQKWKKKRYGTADPNKKEPIFEDSPDPNHKTVSFTTDRIVTVDQLLTAADVDQEEWAIERYQINKWEGYRKADAKQLTWKGGRIEEGFVDDDGSLVIEPLFQVKVWLIRKKPVAIEPVVRPVEITVNAPDIPETFERDTKITVIVPDTHIGFRQDYATGKLIPFHDRVALSIASKVIAATAPDQVIILGDYVDLPDWSDKFARTPDFEQLTQPTLEEAAWWLGTMVSMGSEDTDWYYLEGNHEARMRLMMAKHVPQAYYLKGVGDDIFAAWSIPRLLDLESLGISWIGDYPNGTVWVNDSLAAVHGDGLSADKMIQNNSVDVVFGHLHRFDQSSRTMYGSGDPKVISAICPGFLGRLDGEVPGRKNNQNWSQGMLVVYHTDEINNMIHIPIRGGKAVFDGYVVHGEDWSDKIRRDLGDRWRF